MIDCASVSTVWPIWESSLNPLWWVEGTCTNHRWRRRIWTIQWWLPFSSSSSSWCSLTYFLKTVVCTGSSDIFPIFGEKRKRRKWKPIQIEALKLFTIEVLELSFLDSTLSFSNWPSNVPYLFCICTSTLNCTVYKNCTFNLWKLYAICFTVRTF